MKKIIRTALRKTLLPVLRVKASYSAQSLEKLKHGPAIVCANHVSLLDGGQTVAYGDNRFILFIK